jgi:hypothetical protein
MNKTTKKEPAEKKIKFKTNPFLETLVIKTKSKKVQISALGKDDNVLMNTATGEVAGTSISTYRQVDDAEFVKIFTGNIALLFDLTSAGIKAFNVLMFEIQRAAIKRDKVQIDEYILEDFLEWNPHKKLSKATLYRGLKELIKGQILARDMKGGYYWLNPNFCFNGDRIAFTQVIERKKTEQEQRLRSIQAEAELLKKIEESKSVSDVGGLQI